MIQWHGHWALKLQLFNCVWIFKYVCLHFSQFLVCLSLNIPYRCSGCHFFFWKLVSTNLSFQYGFKNADREVVYVLFLKVFFDFFSIIGMISWFHTNWVSMTDHKIFFIRYLSPVNDLRYITGVTLCALF